MSSVQLQWSLSSILSLGVERVLKGVNSAAGDNVQPQALLACEVFGVTLAMSSDTTNTITREVIATPPPSTIDFWKVTVGYSPNDCAAHLASSREGLKFLALSAALITTVDIWDCARALEIMLGNSSVDGSNIPPVHHLRDLLGSLESRVTRCTFTRLFEGYQQLMSAVAVDRISASRHQNLTGETFDNLKKRALTSVPSAIAIAGLVDVFREVARLGPSTVLGATIKVGMSAAWVIAFTRWCVGTPSVLLKGRKEAILAQKERSLVTIVVSTEAEDLLQPLEATIHHQLKDIHRLLGEFDDTPPPPMVSVDDYVNALHMRLGFRLPEHGLIENARNQNKLTIRILKLVIEHAVPQVLSAMKCGKFGRLAHTVIPLRWTWSLDNAAEDFGISPLPDLDTIAKACTVFLKLNGPMKFTVNDGYMTIADDPTIAVFLESLSSNCECNDCDSRKLQRQGYACKQDLFYQSISFLLMDIFAFSLLESPGKTTIMRLHNSANRGDRTEMQRSICSLLQAGHTECTFEVADVYDWARHLVGHGDIDNDERNLILSYSKGQVIYPELFQTFEVKKNGYLRLRVLEGTLRHKNFIYNLASCPDTPGWRRSPDPSHSFPEVSRPLNLYKDFEWTWEVTPRDNKELDINLLVKHKDLSSFELRLDAYYVLLGLEDALLLSNCPHDNGAKLEPADNHSAFVSPWRKAGTQEDNYGGSEYNSDSSDGANLERLADVSNARSRDGSIQVVPVAGSNALRCTAIVCSDGPLVLRDNSCLACCLTTCRLEGLDILIL